MELERTLRGLLIEHGVGKVNMAWVGLLTTLETQLKDVLHPEVKPKPAIAVLLNTLEAPKGLKISPAKPEPVAPVKVVSEKKMADLNKKKIHKEMIAKRKEMLEAQGITTLQLLTADAMKKWIDEGQTYWDIAEQTGVQDAEISMLAKSYGLQSKVSKKYWSKK
jgi:hypothetical protein